LLRGTGASSLNTLDGVDEGKAVENAPARAVDIKIDLFAGSFSVEEQELGYDGIDSGRRDQRVEKKDAMEQKGMKVHGFHQIDRS